MIIQEPGLSWTNRVRVFFPLSLHCFRAERSGKSGAKKKGVEKKQKCADNFERRLVLGCGGRVAVLERDASISPHLDEIWAFVSTIPCFVLEHLY